MSSDKSSKAHASDKTENAFNESKDYTAEGSATSKATQTSNPATDENKPPKKKITIEVDEDDPCLKGVEEKKEEKISKQFTAGLDPRFQQQNQTLRCYVMYTDFYRCERILGAGSEACTWFQQVYKSICPNEWISQLDRLRDEGKFPWHKCKTQGEFPGSKYGD